MNIVDKLEDLENQVWSSDLYVRQEASSELLTVLSEANDEVFDGSSFQWDSMCGGLARWISGTNFKISLVALKAITMIATRMGEDLAPTLSTLLPAIIDRLGDTKDSVRKEAASLIQVLMSYVKTPKTILDEIVPKVMDHKNAKVREGMLLCISETLQNFGHKELSISKVIPSILELASDNSAPVRDQAVDTLCEVYKLVGEPIRNDILKRRTLPFQKEKMIIQRFDDLFQAGLVNSDGLSDRVPSDESLNSEPEKVKTVERGGGKISKSTSSGTLNKRAMPLKKSASSHKAKGSFHTISPADNLNGGLVVADSGLLTEENLDEYIKDYNTVNISSPKELADFCNACADIMENSDDWEKRIVALRDLRGVMFCGVDHFKGFKLTITGMSRAIEKTVKDLRSQVVREACVTVSAMSTELGNDFGSCGEKLLTALFSQLLVNVKIMNLSAHVCLRRVIACTQYPKMLPIICEQMKSKSPMCRKRAAEYIELIFQLWELNIITKNLSILEGTIKSGINDADSDTRIFSRRTFWLYNEFFPKNAENMMKTFDTSKKKMLQETKMGKSAAPGAGATNTLKRTKKNLAPGSSATLPKKPTMSKSTPDLSQLGKPSTLPRQPKTPARVQGVTDSKTPVGSKTPGGSTFKRHSGQYSSYRAPRSTTASPANEKTRQGVVKSKSTVLSPSLSRDPATGVKKSKSGVMRSKIGPVGGSLTQPRQTRRPSERTGTVISRSDVREAIEQQNRPSLDRSKSSAGGYRDRGGSEFSDDGRPQSSRSGKSRSNRPTMTLDDIEAARIAAALTSHREKELAREGGASEFDRDMEEIKESHRRGRHSSSDGGKRQKRSRSSGPRARSRPTTNVNKDDIKIAQAANNDARLSRQSSSLQVDDYSSVEGYATIKRRPKGGRKSRTSDTEAMEVDRRRSSVQSGGMTEEEFMRIHMDLPAGRSSSRTSDNSSGRGQIEDSDSRTAARSGSATGGVRRSVSARSVNSIVSSETRSATLRRANNRASPGRASPASTSSSRTAAQQTAPRTPSIRKSASANLNQDSLASAFGRGTIPRMTSQDSIASSTDSSSHDVIRYRRRRLSSAGSNQSSVKSRMEDIQEIVRASESSSWKIREEGVHKLKVRINEERGFNTRERRMVLHLFEQMLNDNHAKILGTTLDVLDEFLALYRTNLTDWGATILAKALYLQSMKQTQSNFDRVMRLLDTLHRSFPYDLQLTWCFSILDSRQVNSNAKMKGTLLEYMSCTFEVMDPMEFIQTKESTIGLKVLLQSSTDPKAPDIRKKSATLIATMFRHSPPVFSSILNTVTEQEQGQCVMLLQETVPNMMSQESEVLMGYPGYNKIVSDHQSATSEESASLFDAINQSSHRFGSSPGSYTFDVDAENINPDILNSPVSKISLDKDRENSFSEQRDRSLTAELQAVSNLNNNTNGGSASSPLLQSPSLNGSMAENNKVFAVLEALLGGTQDEKSAALIESLNLLKEDTSINEENSYDLLSAIMSCTEEDDTELVSKSLKVLNKFLVYQADYMAPHCEEVVTKIVRAKCPMQHADSESLYQLLVMVYKTEAILNLLVPMLQHETYPVLLSVINLLYSTLKQNTPESQSKLESRLPALCAAVCPQCSHVETNVRKQSIFCLVELLLIFGTERVDTMLDSLTVSQKKLVYLYYNRHQRNVR
ncbi:CLIP-associating protein 1-A-like isoform X4 [Bolinopsis microptera]|uniref:CLIP-associating protein 1-A-like isoform X4 n=1 Tax=Bolinopsis microptera TaxID=2820187 RepID=UPI003078FEC8